MCTMAVSGSHRTSRNRAAFLLEADGFETCMCLRPGRGVAARDGADYASPLNSLDVKSGKYPIARPLNQYTDGTPAGAVRDFIAFELSDTGQRIVEEEGFFVVPKEYLEFNKTSVGL